MNALARNALKSGIATLTIALAVPFVSAQASAMNFGGLGNRALESRMPMVNHGAPVMNHVGPTLPMMNRVGPALPMMNHVGPAISHSMPATSLPHANPASTLRIARPAPLANAHTEGLGRPTAVQTGRHVEIAHPGGQPNSGAVRNAMPKPGDVARPNLVKSEQGGVGVVRPHVGTAKPVVGTVVPDVGTIKPDVQVLKPDQKVVVETETDYDGPIPLNPWTQFFSFRDYFLGDEREVIVNDGNLSLHVWCRNDGKTGIACHDRNTGRVWHYVEDDNGLTFIPPKPPKKPKKPSFISLYDPETDKTTTRTFNPDGTHTDAVEEGNTLNRH